MNHWIQADAVVCPFKSIYMYTMKTLVVRIKEIPFQKLLYINILLKQWLAKILSIIQIIYEACSRRLFRFSAFFFSTLNAIKRKTTLIRITPRQYPNPSSWGHNATLEKMATSSTPLEQPWAILHDIYYCNCIRCFPARQTVWLEWWTWRGKDNRGCGSRPSHGWSREKGADFIM